MRYGRLDDEERSTSRDERFGPSTDYSKVDGNLVTDATVESAFRQKAIHSPSICISVSVVVVLMNFRRPDARERGSSHPPTTTGATKKEVTLVVHR